MNLEDFIKWVEDHYNLDCYQNDLFTACLFAIHKEYESAKINGVPYFEYYNDENLFKEFFTDYLHRIKTLLNSVPSRNSIMTLNIHGVNLNKYLLEKDELLMQITEIESRI